MIVSNTPTSSPRLASAPAPGTVLDGKYRVERLLAEGGMGIVLLATHLQLERPVALKLLRPEALANAKVVDMFEREAKLAAQLESEHVVRVHDVGRLPGLGPYMVMERLEGRDLGALVHAGPLAVRQAVDLVLQACEALGEIHALEILHRDVKPENLFLDERKPHAPVLKIIDFGISKPAPKRGSSGSWTLEREQPSGTPAYMAPERLDPEASIDVRADLWSLGIVLHELLTGELPFPASTVQEVCSAVLGSAPTRVRASRPDVPVELEAVILRCLEKDRSRRFASAGELAAALAPFGRRTRGAAHAMATAPDIEAAGATRRTAPTFVLPNLPEEGGSGRLIGRLMTVAAAAVLLFVGFAGWQWRGAQGRVAHAAPSAAPAAIANASAVVVARAKAVPTATATASSGASSPGSSLSSRPASKPRAPVTKLVRDPRAEFGERR